MRITNLFKSFVWPIKKCSAFVVFERTDVERIAGIILGNRKGTCELNCSNRGLFTLFVLHVFPFSHLTDMSRLTTDWFISDSFHYHTKEINWIILNEAIHQQITNRSIIAANMPTSCQRCWCTAHSLADCSKVLALASSVWRGKKLLLVLAWQVWASLCL